MTIIRPADRFIEVENGGRSMTVEAFLAWDGFEPGRRYWLLDGTVVMMMVSPLGRHQELIASLARIILHPPTRRWDLPA